QAARVAPTCRTYDALARPAARSGEYRFVEMLYNAKASDCGGGIGPESLAVLLDAYANSIPNQADRAGAAFREEMAFAEEQDQKPSEAASGRVLKALRRAVGQEAFGRLCREYGLDEQSAM
ncbi:unnamed protein product, partial [Prorocentrum cordatum]